jgi:hypothetical protein
LASACGSRSGAPVIIETVTSLARASVSRAAQAAPDGYTPQHRQLTSHVGAGAM